MTDGSYETKIKPLPLSAFSTLTVFCKHHHKSWNIFIIPSATTPPPSPQPLAVMNLLSSLFTQHRRRTKAVALITCRVMHSEKTQF